MSFGLNPKRVQAGLKDILLNYARLRKLTRWKQAGQVLKFQIHAKRFFVEG